MKNPIRWTLIGLVLIALLASACSTLEEETLSPLPESSPLLPGKSPLEQPMPTEIPSKSDKENITTVDRLFEMAREDLAQELGIDSADIELVEVESVEWPNSSLGCPQPGMMYLQVLTPGYRLTLEANGQQYFYHTDSGQLVVRCEEK